MVITISITTRFTAGARAADSPVAATRRPARHGPGVRQVLRPPARRPPHHRLHRLAHLAISSVGAASVGWAALLSATAGIAIIGLLNFGVSFALALIVALRARDVPRGESKTLPGAVLHRFFRRPLEFFYPPGDAGPPQATSH